MEGKRRISVWLTRRDRGRLEENGSCAWLIVFGRFMIGTTSHATLDDLVEQCSQEMRLITSCPGAKYSSLFVSSDSSSGYIGTMDHSQA
jgi:hypothetical protein